MRAVVFEQFSSLPHIRRVADPTPAPHGAVIKVEASGVCRSDWHGWKGHDPEVTLPHVPGHEFAGTVEAVGKQVNRFKVGDRVTVPFINACGLCPECSSGNHQVCGNQTQPGFTHWGSFAEFTSADYADVNLVLLDEEMEFDTAASLGCRFATSFRAVVDQGQVRPGQWVAVHGCGGVGLSAIMIANAMGAKVIAVDITDDTLAFARSIGAVAVINASKTPDVVAAIVEITKGGAHVSMDALGHRITCSNSILCLRKSGRHIQVGLLLADQANPAIPMARVIADELQIIGSHGMQAYRYGALLNLVDAGKLAPEKLIRRRINLEESIEVLTSMDSFDTIGVTVITSF